MVKKLSVYGNCPNCSKARVVVFCVLVCWFSLRELDVLTVCRIPAYAVLSPSTSVRKLTVLGVFCMWHISNMGKAVDLRVRSIILVLSNEKVCSLSTMCCMRAVFACMLPSIGMLVSLFISDLCPLIRFFRWLVVIPI